MEYVSETTGTTDPEGVKLYAATDQPVGYLNQTQSAHQGLTAVLWKYVTENGETTKEQVNYSNYQAVPVSYDVGVNTDNPTISAAIQTAIANNNLEQVQAIISGNYGQTSGTQTTDQQQSESQKSESQSGSDSSSQSESDNSGTAAPDASVPDDTTADIIQ